MKRAVRQSELRKSYAAQGYRASIRQDFGNRAGDKLSRFRAIAGRYRARSSRTEGGRAGGSAEGNYEQGSSEGFRRECGAAHRAAGATTAASAKTAADSHFAEQRAAQRAAQQRLAEERAAEQWKRQILAQKNKITNLQARIVQLHASIEAASGGVQSEYPLNRYQARQLQRAAQIQQQLGCQQRKLEQMQDAARHAGMHTAVYDP